MTYWYQQRYAPSPGTSLCPASDVMPGAVREFRFGGDSPFAFRMFVTNNAGEFIGFRNSCPHFDVPLNHSPEELLTADGRHYLCTTHYAEFDRLSGLCVYGPCEGEYLERIPLAVENGQLLIAGHG